MDLDFTLETITPDASSLLTIGGTGALQLPASTTINRPGAATAGAIRWNTTNSVIEYYGGTSWFTFFANLGVSTQTGTYTETSVTGFKVILANAISGNVIVNLPTSSSATGLVYSTKKIDTSINTVSVTPNGTDTIDGGNTAAIIRQPYTSITLISNGSGGWFII